MTLREKFEVPKRYNTVAMALMALGILAIVGLYITTHGGGGSAEEKKLHDARFWASLLQNSVYFLLIVNAAMFFICATTLTWGGWQLSFIRVAEAVSAVVPVIGVLTLAILFSIVFGDNHTIYHWTDAEHVKHDTILNFKKGFLNKGFYVVTSVLAVGLWSFLGWKMRKLSRKLDNAPLKSNAEGKKFVWNTTVWSAIYMIVFALTVMSSIPWLWLMSIDAHWFSTMYSWYTFASTWVSGVALITLFIIYLKNNNYLELTNKEHLHEMGIIMFAFSVFWTYLWFSQFMLTWYANIPEETTYFKPRLYGIYGGVFWLMFLINFLAPLLILMTRNSKRNYATLTFMSVLIIFGHWLDFFQMVFPGPSPGHVPLIIYDFAIALGFIGLILYVTGKSLSKYPLIAKNHPFLKESVIHHT
ncbi:MAG TPA: quinol:cytochrome C oxidoreductase [Chitinophagaceae bacterium]|nr:quinol:cytochrome C oxidoreductase [Chitinophagaceae bacterium]